MTEQRVLATSRELPFTASQIYAAFASAEQLACWWGPQGFTNTFEIFDFVVGGRWKFVMHGPDGSNYQNESYFEHLEPNAKIVIRHDCPPYFRLHVQLVPTTQGTELLWQQEFDDAATAQAVKQIVGPANEQNLDRLTAVLKRQGVQ